MTMPSLTAQFNKASYESIWALIDGNYRTGNFGPLTDRLTRQRSISCKAIRRVFPVGCDWAWQGQ